MKPGLYRNVYTWEDKVRIAERARFLQREYRLRREQAAQRLGLSTCNLTRIIHEVNGAEKK